MSDTRDALIAFGLCCAILCGVNYFYRPSQEQPPVEEQASEQVDVAPSFDAIAPTLPRDEALKLDPRIAIRNENVSGSINLKGARIDDLSLVKYKQTTAPNSPDVTIFSPSDNMCYASVAWKCGSECGTELPTGATLWTMKGEGKGGELTPKGDENAGDLTPKGEVKGGELTPKGDENAGDLTPKGNGDDLAPKGNEPELTPNSPVELTWTNSSGVTFVRTFTIDENFLISIRDKVVNNSDANVMIAPSCEIVREVPNNSKAATSAHEGAVGYFDDDVETLGFDKLKKGNRMDVSASEGWCGFTDKYWLTSFVIKQASNVSVFAAHPAGAQANAASNVLHCNTTGKAVVVKKGETFETSSQLFAGAKVLKTLDKYCTSHSIKKLDLAVDFGWFYFITKPLFYLLQLLHSLLGSVALAILALTVLSKLALFPMASASQRSMMRMKDLQPKIALLKQRFGSNKLKMQEELLLLYKKEQINPMSGFLPLFVQMPIFFCLYKVLSINIEMRHAPLGFLVTDLSSPDPTSLFNLFGLIPWTVPAFLQIGVLPLVMCGTMFLQQKCSSQPTDPTQAKMMYIMPLVFLFMSASFPAGLVFYWTVSNVLSICQQIYITKSVNNQRKGASRKC
ncbi:MAG: membrane protein insertase YidC [Holosporales bacterium]|nr:membrane protein insertase YidC [Holosporales bacterium]